MTQKQANLLMATVSIGWGTSYIFMKLLADTASPFTVVALRFGIAFLIMIIIFNKKLISVNTKLLGYSAIVGLLLWDFHFTYVWNENNICFFSRFLTSTTVILVPVLQTLITRKLPRKEVIYGVITVSIGLALLTIKDDFTFAFGSTLCLLGATLWDTHCNYKLFCSKGRCISIGYFSTWLLHFFLLS